MKKVIALLFSFMLLIPTIVHAECSNDEINQYKKEAKKVEIEIEHWSGNYFYTKVNNLNDNIYVINVHGDKFTNSDAQLYNYSGKSITYYVKSNKCDSVLREIKITYPDYNKYNNTEECFLNPDFEYCEKFTTDKTENLKKEEFTKKYKEYKESKIKKKENKTLYIAIGIGSAILVSTIVIFIIVKNKKNRRKKF